MKNCALGDCRHHTVIVLVLTKRPKIAAQVGKLRTKLEQKLEISHSAHMYSGANMESSISLTPLFTHTGWVPLILCSSVLLILNSPQTQLDPPLAPPEGPKIELDHV